MELCRKVLVVQDLRAAPGGGEKGWEVHESGESRAVCRLSLRERTPLRGAKGDKQALTRPAAILSQGARGRVPSPSPFPRGRGKWRRRFSAYDE